MTGVLFADVQVEDLLPNVQKMHTSTRDALMVFGALAALTLVLLLWAMFVRKRRRSDRLRREHRHSHEGAPASHQNGAEEAGDERHRRRKFRRRRREHRPRNPTLAETGGLPPLRSGESRDSNP
jgi:flagellar biosynthesis/type III secretory pathway M-ring protein FliF/YscJ